jgi:hypothetical protein
LTYQVKTNEGGVWRRHVDQMRKTSENMTSVVTDTYNLNTLVPNEMHSPTSTNNTVLPGTPAIPSCAKTSTDRSIPSTDRSTPNKPQIVPKQNVQSPPRCERRYPVRGRKPTKRLIAE